jgi:hypothetical protein
MREKCLSILLNKRIFSPKQEQAVDLVEKKLHQSWLLKMEDQDAAKKTQLQLSSHQRHLQPHEKEIKAFSLMNLGQVQGKKGK